MHSDLALKMTSELCWMALVICGPILGLTLLVGVVVSMLQVVTQIQEASLTFVPKLLTAGLTVILLGPWMMRKLTHFATGLWDGIPALF
ncbi:flagellar type III secretion system protein FliQ [Xylophilus rhododendri]|uniref:Flagellar type III secretion system protein FliQ n=1 Tax=Xylophilus rhododendri TaxID=2697032 RepID=A0A857J635_9BURK|nr:flagellar biosynthetic protein FliQ [Xylophilus rhododendri]QHI99177.1 flagellar type III secretion system protein FliQ [Xylophilus rhododendri]